MDEWVSMGFQPKDTKGLYAEMEFKGTIELCVQTLAETCLTNSTLWAKIGWRLSTENPCRLMFFWQSWLHLLSGQTTAQRRTLKSSMTRVCCDPWVCPTSTMMICHLALLQNRRCLGMSYYVLLPAFRNWIETLLVLVLCDRWTAAVAEDSLQRQSTREAPCGAE